MRIHEIGLLGNHVQVREGLNAMKTSTEATRNRRIGLVCDTAKYQENMPAQAAKLPMINEGVGTDNKNE